MRNGKKKSEPAGSGPNALEDAHAAELLPSNADLVDNIDINPLGALGSVLLRAGYPLGRADKRPNCGK